MYLASENCNTISQQANLLQNHQNIQYPNNPNTQPLPYQLPLASLIPQYPQGKGPYGDTGPVAVVFLASGAAGGLAYIRRQKNYEL